MGAPFAALKQGYRNARSLRFCIALSAIVFSSSKLMVAAEQQIQRGVPADYSRSRETGSESCI
jgi:hypothetical protein